MARKVPENEKRPPWRPREHDRDAIALALLEWGKKNDSINLCAFADEWEISPTKVNLFATQDKNFREAYEITKARVAIRRELMLNKEELHVKAYDLNHYNYDLFSRQDRNLQLEFESNLKQKEKQVEDNKKFVFEVNYQTSQNECKVKILPENISTIDFKGAE